MELSSPRAQAVEDGTALGKLPAPWQAHLQCGGIFVIQVFLLLLSGKEKVRGAAKTEQGPLGHNSSMMADHCSALGTKYVLELRSSTSRHSWESQSSQGLKVTP